MAQPLKFHLKTQNLVLEAGEAVWDSAIYSHPVLQIERVQIFSADGATRDYAKYEQWRAQNRIGIVSCRLNHEQLRESMLLEAHDFRFVEMVLHPYVDRLDALNLPAPDLEIHEATADDLEALQCIAQSAFGYERYHIDPRLDPRLGDQRYSKWVKNTLDHPSQRLIKIVDGGRLIGFFIVEATAGESIYWHLTAIAPEWQGSGYGIRAWRAMLSHHQANRIKRVMTTISARNTRVLNLYSKLQFRFSPPEMTFHWINVAL